MVVRPSGHLSIHCSYAPSVPIDSTPHIVLEGGIILSSSRRRAMLGHVTGYLFPSLMGLTPHAILECVVLWPLELYESMAIVLVSILRRHMPVVGGAVVILMTLHGILLRVFLDMMHNIFARITYSRDPELNFRTFWLTMRDRYAFMQWRQVDWSLAHQLFGEAITSSTSEVDLWIAMQECIAMCEDASVVLTRNADIVARGRALPTDQRKRAESAIRHVMQTRHLTDGGRVLANNLVFGILNAETSPGWRIGYVSLSSMEGFVDFPLPRLDSLAALWSQDASWDDNKSNLRVPETYDLESMRWALDAILRSLGELDGLVLDLRCNAGGGSLNSALAVASFFLGPQRSVAFMTDERLPGSDIERFSRKKRYYAPNTTRASHYGGKLVVLQGQYTRGTAELLCVSLMGRANTCRIGSQTAGNLSQTEKIYLPNCWMLEIPYQRCFSATDQLFEGKGIPADKEVVASKDHSGIMHESKDSASRDTFDSCVKKAVEHIIHG